MMKSTLALTIGVSFLLLTPVTVAAEHCCLCSDCDMMMDETVQLYDEHTESLLSCERLAEELSQYASQAHQCGTAQALFQSKCCLVDQQQSVTTSTQEERRELWSAKPYTFQNDWAGKSASTTTVYNSQRTFGSNYTPWPKSPPKQQPVTSFFQAPPAETYKPPATTTTSSFGNAPQYQRGQVITANQGFKPEYQQCARAAHTCYMHCDSMDVNKQDFTVSVDMSISGRTGSFSTQCYNLQNYFNCENIPSTDIRCGMTRSTYFSVCGCTSKTGWKPNQLLKDYGNTKGVVGQWWIK